MCCDKCNERKKHSPLVPKRWEQIIQGKSERLQAEASSCLMDEKEFGKERTGSKALSMLATYLRSDEDHDSLQSGEADFSLCLY